MSLIFVVFMRDYSSVGYSKALNDLLDFGNVILKAICRIRLKSLLMFTGGRE